MQTRSSKIRVFNNFRFFILVFLQGKLDLFELLLCLQNLWFQPLLHRLSLCIRFALCPSMNLTLRSLILNATPMQIFLKISNLVFDFDIFCLTKGFFLIRVAMSSFFCIFGGLGEWFLKNILTFCKRTCICLRGGVLLMDGECFEEMRLGIHFSFVCFCAIK